jgi:hypothetical protein
MKTLSLAVLLVASLAFVMLGCSDNSAPIAGPNDQALSSPTFSSSLAKGGILNSVTGSAHYRSIPIMGETNVTYSFTAIRHKDGTVSGEVLLRDKGPLFYGKANVYDLKVSGNMAKLAFHFVRGNLATYYPVTMPDISDIFGWLVVIDNGEGSEASDPDYCSMILFTDGSDILDKEISDVDNMEVATFLTWMHDILLPAYLIPYDQYLAPIDHGSVQVR